MRLIAGSRWWRPNRLTGHSSGFFSVYTLPPNQAVSQKSQERINRKRRQVPEYRDTHRLIVRKTKSLVSGLTAADIENLHRARRGCPVLYR